MEGDEITIVLSRASELRSKIANCIDKATRRDRGRYEEEEEEGGDVTPRSVNGDVEGEDEAESLLSICGALESLEEQLVTLQSLQQQQQYEKEAALAEIDHSRKILLEKIKEYKGEDLEVVHEASAFACETVEHNDDLLLPPYPNRPPHPSILDNDYPSIFSSAPKFPRNKVIHLNQIQKARKSTSELEKEQTQPPNRDLPIGLKLFSVAAKTVLTIVSVVSVLGLAGFEPRLRKRSTQFKVLDLFHKSAIVEKSKTIECPPGKFLVMEDGEPRCLVKERVEIPFESVVTTPNVNYGCG